MIQLTLFVHAKENVKRHPVSLSYELPLQETGESNHRKQPPPLSSVQRVIPMNLALPMSNVYLLDSFYERICYADQKTLRMPLIPCPIVPLYFLRGESLDGHYLDVDRNLYVPVSNDTKSQSSCRLSV